MGVIYLARHGQASLFGRDYDKLSDVGVEQSRVVGQALAARGVVRPDLIVRGDMERHRETAAAAIEAAGWATDNEVVEVTVDSRWAEIDHIDIIKAVEPTFASHAAMVDALLTRPEPSRAFREVFDVALRGWLRGEGQFVETHREFRERVDQALTDVVRRMGPDDTAVVFSSGGPVAGVLSSALGLDTAEWLATSRMVINGSLTKLVAGDWGVSLVSFNEHAHLEAAGRMTYH